MRALVIRARVGIHYPSGSWIPTFVGMALVWHAATLLISHVAKIAPDYLVRLGHYGTAIPFREERRRRASAPSIRGMTIRGTAFNVTLVALLAGFSTMPLFQPRFFAASDGLLHLYRLMEYDTLLRSGTLYPRWAPDFFFGYGYPIFNYYAPLTYYFAEVFRLLGASYVDSFKLLAGTAMALSGVGAYLYARRFLSPVASILVAVVYMYVPYHIANLYYRGDIAEYLAYTWFPFVLWSFGKVVESRRPSYLAIGGLFFAALILTHNLSAFMFTGFLVIYCLGLLWQEGRLRHGASERLSQSRETAHWRWAAVAILLVAATLLLGLALSAFFWLPALAEKSLVSFDNLLLHFSFRDHFLVLDDLLPSSLIHPYGLVFRHAEDRGYNLAVLQALFLALGVLVLFWCWKRLKVALRAEAVVSMVVVALSLFLALPASLRLWENVPLLSLAQFPWRFLAFVGLPSALLAGVLAEVLSARRRSVLVAFLVPLVIFSSTAGMFPVLPNVTEEDISPAGSLQFELMYGVIGTSSAAEYLPKWVNNWPSMAPAALAATRQENQLPLLAHAVPGLDLQTVEKKANRAIYRVSSPGAVSIVLNTLYFPGWQAFVDGSRVNVGADSLSGLIRLSLPAGEHTLALEFAETRLRLESDGISALALLASLLLLVWSTAGRWLLSIVLARRRWRVLVEYQASGLGGLLIAPTRARVGPSAPHGRTGPSAPTGDTWFNVPARRREVCSREALAGVAVFVALGATWLLSKAAYDHVYVPAQMHRYPLIIDVDNQIQIEGCDLSSGRTSGDSAVRTSPGSTLQLVVYWHLLGQAPSAGAGRDFRAIARLTNTFNQTWAYAESAPSEGTATGDTVASVVPLTIPAATPPGVYDIALGFQDTLADQDSASEQIHMAPILPGERGGRIGPVVVEKDFSDGAPPSRLHGGLLAQPVDFQRQVRLLDYGVANDEVSHGGRPGQPLALTSAAKDKEWSVSAGETVHLDMLWQALEKMGENLTVTARLAGDGPTLWAIRDSQPADGMYPTSFWNVNEVVRDQLNLRIPAETPPGSYRLELELVSANGPLSIIDGRGNPIGSSLELGTLAVAPPSERPAIGDLKMQHRIERRLTDAVTVVGYSLSGTQFQPGDRIHLDLYWLATAIPQADLKTDLGVLDQQGKLWSLTTTRPVGDIHPTNLWKAGDVWRGQYNLVLPAAIPGGTAHIVLRLEDVQTGGTVASLDLDEVQVLSRARVFSALPQNPLVSELGGEVRVLGYDLAVGQEKPQATVGATPVTTSPQRLEVTIYWQAIAEMRTSETAFVQVLSSAGQLVAQDDSIPARGGSPTTGWLAGEVTADTHSVDIPANLPEGDYTIITGLYDASSGQRLPSESGEDFVRLTHIRITHRGETAP